MTITRRAFLAGSTSLLADTSALAADPARLRWTLTVVEPEGIRRFGYPVSVGIPFDKPPDATRFRLLDGDKPIAAQFRLLPIKEPGWPTVQLDFTVNHAPHEKKTYTVEYGPDLPAVVEPKGGMSVTQGERSLTVAHSTALQYELPADVGGLLTSVRAGKIDYLRPESKGLALSDQRGQVYFVRNMESIVTRSGPQAVGLRARGETAVAKGKAASTVDLEFPRSKSWVRVDWSVQDNDGVVMGMHAMLYLHLEGTPTLVDFGAGSSVYVHLKDKQMAMMRAGRFSDVDPLWETLTGKDDPTIPNTLTPYVVAPKRTGAPLAEGWAHVMDKDRCTAVAVADFAADKQRSTISTNAEGLLQIGRTFAAEGTAPPKGAKRLTFWLHFVSMPVHVGALTSPQAMLAPLRVEVKEMK